MRGMKLTPEKRNAFLDALRTIPNVTRACRAVKVSRQAAYACYHNEPDFAKLWDEALEEGLESLEAEAHRRAFEGYPGRPIVHEGFVIQEMVEYSDTLAIFLLKAHAPEKYRERLDVKANVKGAFTVVSGVPDLEPDPAAGLV